MSKLEKDEEAAIKKWCDKRGLLFIKFTPMGEKGWPDRIAILPDGTHVWIELKRNGKKPTKLQHHRMNTLKQSNVIITWYDSAEECIDFLEAELNAI